MVSVGGIMVSIVAFQAIDPGSIPGQCIFFLYPCCLLLKLPFLEVISWNAIASYCTTELHNIYFHPDAIQCKNHSY